MKILAISDIHSNLLKVKELRKTMENNGIELILVCGDITHEGFKQTAEEILKELSFAPVLAVQGNMDSKEVAELLEEKKISLHKKKKKINGYTFVGLGGAKPVNTYYRTNLGELEAKKYLNQLIEGEKDELVIVSHSPPQDSGLDMTDAGYSLGLNALTEAIKKFQPLLVLCGHVHERKGKTMIGKTLCINIGPLKDGNALLIELIKGMKPKTEWIEVT